MVRWLDDGFRVPGTRFRFGLDPILGLLVPGLGDGLTALLALALIAQGVREGVPGVVLARMVLNVGVDALVGIVPVLGDLVDFAWRANRKNLDLLERHRRPGGAHPTPGDWATVGVAALALLAIVAVPIAAAIVLAAWLFE